MQKRGSYILLNSFIFAFLLLNSVSAATIFNESFDTGFDWTTSLPAGWTASDDATSGMDDQFSITGGSDGNRYAWINGSGGTSNQDITRSSISTSGFENIKIAYYYNLIGLSPSDFLVVEWKKTTDVAFTLIQKVTGVSGWNTVIFNLPSSAANTNIDIRFTADDTEATDFILIDDINISGALINNCGNNQLDNGEHCDDGNDINNDGCTNTCTITFCGDVVVQQPNGQGTGGINNDGIESCDDGNLVNNDNCDNNCKSTIPQAVCGNSIVETGEQCDDGGTANGDGCNSTCQIELPVCGNNVIEIGEDCELPSTANNAFCSQSQQTCQGNKTGTRDASGNCNSICGCVEDSFVFQCVEDQCGAQCDSNDDCNDLNQNTIDTCNLNSCGCEHTSIVVCGNNVIDFGEQCDDGNLNNHDNCLNTCQLPICGDGFLWIGNEQCDDGNNLNGDGCNAACFFEGGEQCFAPVDIMLVIDRSGSMILPPDTQRLVNAKAAAITFLGEVDFSKDTVGLTSFNETATLNLGLTNNQVDITNAINALKAGGQTNIGNGLKVARQELVANGGDTKALILLSDGSPNVNASGGFCVGSFKLNNSCAKHALNESNATKLAGIKIFTIGLGVDNTTETLLKQIATTPGDYFFAPNSSQLESIYLQIAQDICPCEGFDCSINSDQCNVGSCNLNTDQCEFNQQPLSTSCEEDGDKCTTQHCDGQGACLINDTVDVPAPQECKSFFCDSNDGLIKENVTGFPLSTSCDTDQNACTIQHCNGGGACVVNATVSVPPPEQCQSFFCDPNDGLIKPDIFQPESTPCSTDNNECTIQHCNGQGGCVINPQAEIPPECFGGDAKVSQSLQNSNFGTGRYMIVNPKQGTIDRSYIRIDISHLINNVTSAKLKLAVYQTGGNASGSGVQAWYCKDHDFIETTITWSNQPFDGNCILADTLTVPNEVVAGIPETFHEFDLTNGTNLEIDNGDGLFTIVLRSELENTGINHNKKHVQYLTKEYPEVAYKPKFVIS